MCMNNSMFVYVYFSINSRYDIITISNRQMQYARNNNQFISDESSVELVLYLCK